MKFVKDRWGLESVEVIMWTKEMQILYETIKEKGSNASKEEENKESAWRQYPEGEYIEKYSYSVPQEFSERLLHEIGNDGKEYIIPIVVSIMKNKPEDEKISKGAETGIELPEDKIPDYIYSF